MEKTIYEIKYNEWFHVRMTSEREPMEEIAFDKTALEAVLTDLVMRGRDQPETLDQTAELWRWVCSQIGLAMQNTQMASDAGQDPLDTVLEVVSKFKEQAAR